MTIDRTKVILPMSDWQGRCSQHHLGDKICYPFTASLLIIKGPKAQTVVFSLTVKLPCCL